MTKQTRTILMVFCSLAAMWDVVTTFKGLEDYFNNAIIAAIATFFINGVLFFSSLKIQNNVVKAIGVVLFIASLVGDSFTAYQGNMGLMDQSEAKSKVFVAVVLTIITVGSTITLSYLYFRSKTEDIIEEETESKKKLR